jgi:ABC-type branched-subunit amino acid transport system permease subunit
MAYYITTLLVYAGVDAIACLALSQQFGVAGVTNFGFIIFQAAGAYAAAVLSLPSDSSYGGSRPTSAGCTCPSRCRGSAPRSWVGSSPCRSPPWSGSAFAETSPP